MDLLHLVDRLEELVAGAQKMPIGNRAIVDRRRMLDLIDQMRIAVPREVREAQDIVAERDGIRREAEEEGRIIVAQAEERAADLIAEHAITEGAKLRAEEISIEAERRLEQQIATANRDMQARALESRRVAQEQMSAADDYARELLIRLERQLQAFQNSVRAGVEQLEPPPITFDPGVSRLDDRRTVADRVPASEDFARAAGPSSGLAAPALAGGQDPYEVRTPVDYTPPPPDDLSFTPDDRYPADDDELVDLLGRQRAMQMEPPPPSDPGVIDDFENQPLDDDPMLRPTPRDRGDRE